MSASTHRVEVVRVTAIEPHPNANALGIVRTCGYQVCVRLADWRPGMLGAYVQPDSVVPLTEGGVFAFLRDPKKPDATTHRVRVVRLRGQLSQGLLVPAPGLLSEGDDAATAYGVTRYQPPETSAEDAPAPSGWAPVFDLESARAYADRAFVVGEPLWVTEKIHGENGRWTFRDGRMHSGSRTRWKADDSAWSRVLRHHPEVVAWCEANPGAIVYGELYGGVGGYPYGVPKGERRIVVFDVWRDGGFLGPHEARDAAPGLPWVPVLARRTFVGLAELLPLAEGATVLGHGAHLREGCVVRPLVERDHPEAGRVALKIVGDGFMERER